LGAHASAPGAIADSARALRFNARIGDRLDAFELTDILDSLDLLGLDDPAIKDERLVAGSLVDLPTPCLDWRCRTAPSGELA
jgi:hypothetical protein